MVECWKNGMLVFLVFTDFTDSTGDQEIGQKETNYEICK